MFNTKLFEDGKKDNILIADTDIIFVADAFKEDYVGGAELTTQALIDSSPFTVKKIRSHQLTMELLEKGHKNYWVFGNYAGVDKNLIPTIMGNLDYSILEYDYKYCKYRSPQRHEEAEKTPCTCENDLYGKMIAAFMMSAKSLWWMSEAQQQIYFKKFPALSQVENHVLSSVFDDQFFITLKLLREKYKNHTRKGWVVLGSTSWVKGAGLAEQWCKDNGKEYEVVWGLEYGMLLEKLAQAEGFVYLPQGWDTCPRMVIEAKLLGCKLHLNEDVQHKDEEWFDTEDNLETESYLYAARDVFWKGIKHNMNYIPQLSGYTTTLDCNTHDYPWKECIKSLLGFCDEVVVVDGGSTDGTWEELKEWSDKEVRLVIHQEKRDWENKRFAVFDGAQKAYARSLCTREFCWQQDADEVVHENDYDKVLSLMRSFPRNTDILCLPVVEYWGKKGKVRVDVNPWKWRLSRNNEGITHGIPKALRNYDDDGTLFAKLGTDGCDYIHSDTGDVIPHANFYNNEAHEYRLRALGGDKQALEKYAEWFVRCAEMLPCVHHFSWFDLSRKIRTYRDYWSKHWQSLFDITQEDTAENNMFFQKPWSEVTENDIETLANKLQDEMGGWVFHDPVDFNKPTPYLVLDSEYPQVIKERLEHE